MADLLHLTMLIIHAIGGAIIVGSSFVSLLILINNRIPLENLKLEERISKFVGPVLGIQLLTGLYLGISEWDEHGKNPLFWTKLILFIIVGVIARVVTEKRVASALKKGDVYASMPEVKNWAWISFLLLALILIFGVVLVESHM